VAALINVSREKASTLIRSLAVSHNYTEVEELSANVREGDVVSVRGYGKFKIESISDLTRKGRIKLIAKKYV
jgi:RNA-binding protein YlmH